MQTAQFQPSPERLASVQPGHQDSPVPLLKRGVFAGGLCDAEVRAFCAEISRLAIHRRVTMDYVLFSLGFVIIHTGAYAIAGMLALSVSKDLYQGENRLLDFIRDAGNPDEASRLGKWMIPSQVIRGLLLSLALYPILPALGDLSFGLRFLFMGGLMFIYMDLASAVPFIGNIEGYVYFKERYLQQGNIWKMQFEMVIYSLLFGFFTAWLLF
jgi:hypothetical protein